MYKYKTIIIHLESLIESSGEIAIEKLIKELNENEYKLCIISKKENLNKFDKDIKKSLITKTYEKKFEFKFLIKEILEELKSKSAIILSCDEEMYKAANETSCLSIGKKLENISPDLRYEEEHYVAEIIKKVNCIFFEISNQIVNRKKEENPFLVGINGVDTSGKTEFATEFSRYLIKQGIKIEVIRMDDFHNKSKIRYSHFDPVRSYYENAFDVEKLKEELLEPISNNKKFEGELVHLNLETDEYSKIKKYNITSDTVVLIEGVLLYKDPINTYLDLRIFLDISFDEVLKRASIRDRYLFGDEIVNKYKNKYIPVQKKYINLIKPKEICDILINNENFNNPVILKGL